jgi:hypothetical protein
MRIPKVRTQRLQLLRRIQDGHSLGRRKLPKLGFSLRK